MSLKRLLKKTFVYKVYIYWRIKKQQKRRKEQSMLLHQDGAKILNCFAQALNKREIPFWLDYGTLLGYRRENDFIGHDNDLDIGAFIEDVTKINDALTQAGFKLVRYYNTLDNEFIEHSYTFSDTQMTIDVFFYKYDNGTVLGTCFAPMDNNLNVAKHLFQQIPFKTILVKTPFVGLTRTTFKNSDVYVPSSIDEYLMANYGETFMIPNPNFTISSAPNIKVLSYEEKPAIGYIEIPY